MDRRSRLAGAGHVRRPRYPWPGGRSKGAIDTHNPVPGKATVETLSDDSSKTIEQLGGAASSGNRLLYATSAAKQPYASRAPRAPTWRWRSTGPRRTSR